MRYVLERMLCVALECLKLVESESERSVCPLLGEGASPFIDEGDGLTSERESVCVCYLVLLPMSSGTRRFVSAHNTIDAQMHVVGSIVFLWYGKCWRLPYCRTNVGAHNTVHCSDMSRRL